MMVPVILVGWAGQQQWAAGAGVWAVEAPAEWSAARRERGGPGGCEANARCAERCARRRHAEHALPAGTGRISVSAGSGGGSERKECLTIG